MQRRGRLILLTDADELVVGYATYFILRGMDDVPQFFPREDWSVPPDYPDGTLIYIDRLDCQWLWTRDFVRQIESIIVTRHPQAEAALWHRPRHHAGQHYIYRRRVGRHG